MPDEDASLCDACGRRPATHHICNGNTGAWQKLCEECFQLSASAEQREFYAALSAAHCYYCGAENCGGPDVFSMVMGDSQPRRFMCGPCMDEFRRFTGPLFERDTEGLSLEEEFVLLQGLAEKADAHMKEWVSGRGDQNA